MWAIVGQTVTWLLVLLGWVVVNKLQDFRELRKDRIARISDLRNRMEVFEQKALNFHTSEFDGKAVLMIISALRSIARELKLLKDCGYIDSIYEDDLVEFRQACTGINFDKTEHTARASDDDVCLAIVGTRETLDNVLVTAQCAAVRDGQTIADVFTDLFHWAVHWFRERRAARNERGIDDPDEWS